MKTNTITYPKAFTLVELLIVIVVIAILATISIVAYNGIQERARAASVSTALNQAVKKIKLWQVDNPDTTPVALSDAEFTAPSNTNVQYSRTNNNQDYCITATQGTTSYYLNSTTQTAPIKGGCPGHGQGGVQAITNLVTNPSFEGGTTTGWSLGGDQGNPTALVGPGGVENTNKVTLTKAMPVGSAQFNYVMPGQAGEKYNVGFWAWTQSGTCNASVQLGKNNSSYAAFITQSLALTATPQFFSFSGTSPADTTELRLRMTPCSTGQATNFDGFIITRNEAFSKFADGSSQNWVWNGTQNNSISTGPAL